MFWIPVAWAAMIGGLFAIGLMHAGAWLHHARQRTHLAFAGIAITLGGVMFFELLAMRSQTPAEYGAILRWMHVPSFLGLLAVIAFTRLYLPEGRPWLAYTALALGTVVLMVNFLVEPNVNFRTITGLRHVELLAGERAALAVGEISRWQILATASLLLVVAFVADSALASRRRPEMPAERRRALIVGACLALVLVLDAADLALISAGLIHAIFLGSLVTVALAAVISHDLNVDAVRSARLVDQLRASEAALRDSERRLDDAAAAARLGVWEFDPLRDEVWATGRTRELFGVAADERVGLERVLQALHPADRDAMREAISQSLREGGHYEREYRTILPDGRERWIHTRGGVEINALTGRQLLRGVSLDITERKVAEVRFRQVVEAAPIGLVMFDSEGRITLVNSQIEKDFGYSREELIGEPIESLLKEDTRDQHAERSRFKLDATTRSMAPREVASYRKDGSELAVEIGLTVMDGPPGSEVLATLVDVGERKRAAELLMSERVFLRQVIDIAPTLIFAKDRDGRFTLVNKAVADLYGSTPEGLIGKRDADFNPDVGQVASFRRADLDVIDTLSELIIPEERITDHAGRERWLQTIKRPLRVHDGTHQVLGSATDITASKNSDRELTQLRNDLAHLARVTMLSELSGSLAHELNQPLTAILSNAQAGLQYLSRDKPNLEELREILQDIANDDKRAGDVIKGLRMLLKRGEINREQLDLVEVARDVLRLMRSDMLNGNIALVTEFEQDLPMINGERAQLQQVMLNLLVNGCDAMAGEPSARRQLFVSVKRRPDMRDVVVCVRDHGRGIPSEDLERVFEPFFTTKTHGLGLGLSVCRTIIAAHDGRLWAANNDERGASFTFTLPAMTMTEKVAA